MTIRDRRDILYYQDILVVDSYSEGIVGPSVQPAGYLMDGGTVHIGVPPSCWGPMITPKFHGGHEVTRPVMVEGAVPGDALAIHIEALKVTSIATSSGVMKFVEGNYRGDPFVKKICPKCGTESPSTHLVGTGPGSVRCDNCGASITPFEFANGYVIAFDHDNELSLTVSQSTAENIASNAVAFSAMPKNAEQHSILTQRRTDLIGAMSRMRPFIGNIGTSPSVDMPDSHNAGDYGRFLLNAPHEFRMDEASLERNRTDAHMDTNSVRAGSILICPVKIPGGGVYAGDIHGQMGNGEIAGHATDVSGTMTLRVNVIKGLSIPGPILLQRSDDLPFLAVPYSQDEISKLKDLSRKYGADDLENVYPITFIGSGATLNDATKNGLSRAASVTGINYDEILNRATISGSIEISRLPGVVRVTFMCPINVLKQLNLLQYFTEMYA